MACCTRRPRLHLLEVLLDDNILIRGRDEESPTGAACCIVITGVLQRGLKGRDGSTSVTIVTAPRPLARLATPFPQCPYPHHEVLAAMSIPWLAGCRRGRMAVPYTLSKSHFVCASFTAYTGKRSAPSAAIARRRCTPLWSLVPRRSVASSVLLVHGERIRSPRHPGEIGFQIQVGRCTSRTPLVEPCHAYMGSPRRPERRPRRPSGTRDCIDQQLRAGGAQRAH